MNGIRLNEKATKELANTISEIHWKQNIWRG